MAVTYTNRKGITYYLCQSKTKRGKPRYYFAAQPNLEPIEEMPAGYEIRESPNGIVTVAKARRYKLLPSEIEVVKEAIKQHPSANRFRLDVKPDRIIIHELIGIDGTQLAELMTQEGRIYDKAFAKRIKRVKKRMHRYTAIMQFVLQKDGEEDRFFEAHEISYENDEKEWSILDSSSSIENLANKFIPKLGSIDDHPLYGALMHPPDGWSVNPSRRQSSRASPKRKN